PRVVPVSGHDHADHPSPCHGNGRRPDSARRRLLSCSSPDPAVADFYQESAAAFFVLRLTLQGGVGNYDENSNLNWFSTHAPSIMKHASCEPELACVILLQRKGDVPGLDPTMLSAPSVHADRTGRGDGHHRHADRPTAARCAKSPRGIGTDAMRE